MLAQLLAQYALRRDPDMDVIWVNGWSLEEVEDSGGHFSYLEKKGWALDRNTLFIFDDAQASFKDTYLWGHFFKSVHQWNNLWATAFSSYGTPSPRISVPGMLIQWNNSQKVTLLSTGTASQLLGFCSLGKSSTISPPGSIPINSIRHFLILLLILLKDMWGRSWLSRR